MSEEVVECACGCKQKRLKYDRRGRERQFINGHQSKETRFKKGQKHPWYDRKYVDGNGYIKIYKPDHHFSDSKGYVKEQRLVYEQHNNCNLLPWALVHHKNENKQDNRIENLEVMNRSTHTRTHNPIGYKVGTYGKRSS
jgi:HNH endonuclease